MLATGSGADYANNWLFFHFPPLSAFLEAYGLKLNVIATRRLAGNHPFAPDHPG
jgi:hypothetical protein